MTAHQSIAPKILVVEDDYSLNEQMTDLLKEAGYQVESLFDGDSALLATSTQQYQLMLLDLMLPEKDGISVLRMLRKHNQIPVIIVTAKGAEEERITGLRQGADDYIAKPFNTVELLLRVEALLRRSQPAIKSTLNTLNLDDLTLNRITKQASVNTNALELTMIQFKLLWELILNNGDILSKTYLSQQVLSRALGAYDRSLDMHLSRLRRKLNDAGWAGERLKTVHGKGYCIQ